MQLSRVCYDVLNLYDSQALNITVASSDFAAHDLSSATKCRMQINLKVAKAVFLSTADMLSFIKGHADEITCTKVRGGANH